MSPTRHSGKRSFLCYANVGSEVTILRTICLGGTTTVSAGNGVRALEKELHVFGIDLSSEFEAAEKNGRAWAKRFA
jgi:hypothetical protein